MDFWIRWISELLDVLMSELVYDMLGCWHVGFWDVDNFGFGISGSVYIRMSGCLVWSFWTLGFLDLLFQGSGGPRVEFRLFGFLDVGIWIWGLLDLGCLDSGFELGTYTMLDLDLCKYFWSWFLDFRVWDFWTLVFQRSRCLDFCILRFLDLELPDFWFMDF